MDSHITKEESRLLYKVLCCNDASTLDPDREQDSERLNFALDKLRFMLMEIRDRRKRKNQ